MSLTPEPGCYVDSHYGQYAIARVVEVAVDLGWDDAEANGLAARHLASSGASTRPSLSDDEYDRLIDSADDAESWLNEHHRPEGYWWSWNDGDFGLYAEGEVD